MSDPVGFDWFDPTKTMDLIAERQKLYDAQDHTSLNTVGRPMASESKAEPVEQPAMSERGQRWYDLLPKQVRPNVLRCKFPHILEGLTLAWSDPTSLNEEFKSLLLVDRGARQGFPFAVLQELHCLRDYYFDELNPEGVRKAFGKTGLTDQSR